MVAQRFFLLIIHDSRLPDPTNLNFRDKFLCTCIKTFSVEFLYRLNFSRYFLSEKFENANYRAHQFVIEWKDLTSLSDLFTCVLKVHTHLIPVSLRNGDLNVKIRLC